MGCGKYKLYGLIKRRHTSGQNNPSCKLSMSVFLDAIASLDSVLSVSWWVGWWVIIAQWESARPNLDPPNIEARSEVSA